MKYIAVWFIITSVFKFAGNVIPGEADTIIAGCLMVFAVSGWKVSDDIASQVIETVRAVCKSGDLNSRIMEFEEGVGETLLTLLPKDSDGEIIHDVMCPVVRSNTLLVFKGCLHIKIVSCDGHPSVVLAVRYAPSENEHGYRSRIKDVSLV